MLELLKHPDPCAVACELGVRRLQLAGDLLAEVASSHDPLPRGCQAGAYWFPMLGETRCMPVPSAFIT